MKEKYVELEIETIRFEEMDVITSSDDCEYEMPPVCRVDQ